MMIGELEASVIQLTEELKEAMQHSARASRDETAVRNRLNEAQKALDTYVEKLKKDAPRLSDWGRE